VSSILHVIPRLTRGGASHSLLTAVEALSARGGDHRHTIASLRRGDVEMDERARQAGVGVIHEPGAEQLEELIAAAEVVQLDWWNTPEMGELLRSRLPEARLVAWSHVGGRSAPQVLTDELIALPDEFVASTPISGLERVIPDIADPARVAGVQRREGEGYVVGYIGTVDPAKMHPRFVAMSAAVRVPGSRFVVAGTGDGFAAIARRAEELGARERFDLRGYVRDVAPVLSAVDVFGYPLCRGNYGAAELVVQEAMHAGIPPVVLPYGGAATLVEDGVTGLVAADEPGYTEAVEALGRDPELRRRLGDAAREHARRTWSPAAVAADWARVYEELLTRPKRARDPLPPIAAGAESFVAGLGEAAAPFRVSLAAADLDAALAADAEIGASDAVLLSSDGGLLDYRRRYPEDPHLRLWSGLALRAQGRKALAAGELAGAIRLGCDRRRADPMLAQITEQLGVPAAVGER